MRLPELEPATLERKASILNVLYRHNEPSNTEIHCNSQGY